MDRIRRVLEIAASTRVLRERRRALLGASPGGVVLGAHFLTLRGVAEHCAAETGADVRGMLDEPGFVRLVRGCAASSRRLGGLLRERPGLAPALAATLRDLYDAGLEPETLPDEARDLAGVYAATLRGLARLRDEGILDRVGLFRLAREGARDWVGRLGFAQVRVHGATELVGSAGDLVEAIADAAPLRMLQTDWASPYGEQLRSTWPWRFVPEPTEVLDAPALPRDGDVPEDALSVVRAPGPRDEIEGVARQVLRLLGSGVAPARICVVARTLEPHAAWIESSFTRLSIPFTSSLVEPLIRRPDARVWLDLIETIFEDLERGATLRLLRSPRLRASRGHERGFATLAEWLSRRAGVVRGAADWRAALDEAPRIAHDERRSLDAPGLGALRGALDQLISCAAAVRAAGSFADCGRRLVEAADGLLAPPADTDAPDADAQLRDALARVALLDRVDAAARVGGRPAAEDQRAALERAVVGSGHRPRDADDGGVRVLDALQARGVACDHLFIVGLVHGAWPRDQREDPFLPGALRERLRRETGRPVPTPGLADAEERFLMGLLLSQARVRVTLSWAESDSAGHELAPSSLLRSLPFVAPRTSVIERARAWPPADDLLHVGQALVRAALAGDPQQVGGSVLALAGELAPELEQTLRPGLEQLIATERLESDALAYDGVLASDALRLPERLSPSLIETLGQCPLRGFFSGVLRVPGFDALPADALEARERGSFVHRVLAHLYRALHQAGALEPGFPPADKARRRAIELLPGCVDAGAQELRRRLRERHPRLWAATRQQLQQSALDFVERDLPTLLPEGVVGLELEERMEFSVETQARELPMRGTPDRVLHMGSGTVRLGDYKTRRDTRKEVSKTEVARGSSLQIPLYLIGTAQGLGSDRVEGEALAVPPRPERDRRNDRQRRPTLSLESARSAAAAPLDVVARLLRDACFPFREDDHCRYCDYAVACRNGHAASEERVRTAGAFADYFGLRGGAS